MVRGLLGRCRLLPLTMAGLAVLLVVKAAGLVGAAYGARQAPSPGWPELGGGGAAAPVLLAAASPPVPLAEPEARPSAPGADANKPDANKPDTARPAAAQDTMPSPAERSLLLDLRKRRTELDARAAAIDQREALLGAAEKRLATRVDELTALQTRLEALDAARRDRDEAGWRGLVRVYETMKPRDAAAIFDDLDGTVLLQVVDRMKDARAAAILAAMTPDRARRLTADLSALRARANTPPESLAPGASP